MTRRWPDIHTENVANGEIYLDQQQSNDMVPATARGGRLYKQRPFHFFLSLFLLHLLIFKP